MAQLYCCDQHPVQRNKHRNLNHDRQATTERINLFFLVKLHHCGVELDAIISKASLYFFELGADQFHFSHAAARLRIQRIKHTLNQNGKQNDGPAPVAHQSMEPLEQPEHRSGEKAEDAVVNNDFKTGSGCRQLVLLLRAHEDRHVDFGRCARRYGADRGFESRTINVALFLRGVDLALGTRLR